MINFYLKTDNTNTNTRKTSKTIPQLFPVSFLETTNERIRLPTFSKPQGENKKKTEQNNGSTQILAKKISDLLEIKSKKELKPILKTPSFNEGQDPFKINLLDIYRETPPLKRSSSVLTEYESMALKKNPKTNLIAFFKEKTKKNDESPHSSSFYSSRSFNSPRKTKKSATFSIVLHPSFNAQNIIKDVERQHSERKKISQVLRNVPKTKYSLSLKPCDKINQYVLIKDIANKMKKFPVKKLAFTEKDKKQFYVISRRKFMFFITFFDRISIL